MFFFVTQYQDIDVERDTPSLVRDLERLIIQLQVIVTFIERFVHFLHFKLMSREPMSLVSSGMPD